LSTHERDRREAAPLRRIDEEILLLNSLFPERKIILLFGRAGWPRRVIWKDRLGRERVRGKRSFEELLHIYEMYKG
jgi:hypothetical protein